MDETETNNLGNLSDSIKDLVRAMLVTNPDERLSLAHLKTYLHLMQDSDFTDTATPLNITLCTEAR